MALLSIIVRQAQYSGDKSITSQYCTYVTLTLDRCRTTTVAVKGHNPHWEQDYLFETQNTSRGLLIEVWKQDEYLHTPIGCYWLPLNMVRYSNEHTTGLWASLGSELYIEDGVIVKSVNATGHFLLYDARFEDPDDRRVSEHATVENENVEEYYPSTTSRRANESVSNKSTPASISAEPSDEWYRYDNYQDGYRSSSSENVRSDLDYSYSETSNHMDRRSCYESSEKSLEKEQYSHDDRNEQYYGDYEQSESYKASNSYGKRSNYENQIDDADEQWVSDEYAEEQADDEVYQNSHHDYGPSDGEYSFSYHHQSSHLKGAENDTKMYNHDGSYEDDELEEDDVDDEVDDEPDDGRYYENSYVYVQSPPTNKRILPSIPSYDSPTTPSLKKPPSSSLSMQNYHKNNYYYDQYKDKNGDNYTPRVPSIYIDSPTLSPCLSASKSTSFDYRDQHSDDSASIYQYSDNSMTAQRNEKTYCKTNSIHRYRRTNETSDNNFTRINADDYCSNEDAEEYGDYVNDEGTYSNDYYDYEDDYVAPAAKPDDRGSEIQDRNDDDINNNQLNSRRSSARSYVKKLCSSPFEKEEVTVPETYDANRKEAFQSRGKTSPLIRQSNSFTEQFEWTYNEIPEDDYDTYETAAQPLTHQEPEPVSSSIHNGFTKPSFYNNPIDSILEEDYNEDDDVTLVSPVNSSSLSPRSMNYLSQEKDHDTQETYDKENSLESYHEDLGKTSPTSEIDQFNDSSMADHTVDSYHSSYPQHKSSIGETNSLPNDTNSLIENENETDNFVMDKLEIVPPEPRKSSLQKEENNAELRRMRARNRWHNAYNKIIHQLNVSIPQVGCNYAIILRNFYRGMCFSGPYSFFNVLLTLEFGDSKFWNDWCGYLGSNRTREQKRHYFFPNESKIAFLDGGVEKVSK